MWSAQLIALLHAAVLVIPLLFLCDFYQIKNEYQSYLIPLPFAITSTLVLFAFVWPPVWISRLIDWLLQIGWLCDIALAAAYVIPLGIAMAEDMGMRFLLDYMVAVVISLVSLFGTLQARTVILNPMGLSCAISIWELLLVYGRQTEGLLLIIPWALAYVSKEQLRVGDLGEDGERRADVPIWIVAVTETKARLRRTVRRVVP